MPLMELSEKEKALIVELRQKDVRRNQIAKMLKLAHDYHLWMEENQCGTTYSMFCDDFGYHAEDGEDRTATYEAVVELIRTARFA